MKDLDPNLNAGGSANTEDKQANAAVVDNRTRRILPAPRRLPYRYIACDLR
jgi:hypothetical protein